MQEVQQRVGELRKVKDMVYSCIPDQMQSSNDAQRKTCSPSAAVYKLLYELLSSQVSTSCCQQRL